MANERGLRSAQRNILWVFAAASLVAVCAGCGTAALSGVPAGTWARNLGAWVIGALAAVALSRASGNAAAGAALGVALIGVSASLVFPGLSGVHRWISLGPLRLNAAELLLPMAVVALGLLGRSRIALVGTAILAAILALQPDWSQAIALAGAVIAGLWSSTNSLRTRGLGAIVPVLAAAVSFARPDPLKPVPEVEGIVGLAWAISPVIAVLGLTALGAASAAPLLTKRRSPTWSASVGLCAYLTLSAAASLIAPFPVPLLGVGFSPVLGAWLGIGLLASRCSSRAISP